MIELDQNNNSPMRADKIIRALLNAHLKRGRAESEIFNYMHKTSVWGFSTKKFERLRKQLLATESPLIMATANARRFLDAAKLREGGGGS